MLIIAFPLLQHGLSFYESGKLHGAVSGIPDPPFNWKTWWAGDFQAQKSAYLNDSTGCRPDLVRLNNQLDFWMFRKLHAHSVVAGKNDCLFEQEYVDEYYGRDCTGADSMRKAVVQLRKVQDTLERLGKTLVFLYAPSKAYYFADQLPPRSRGAKTGATTNYAIFKRLADEAHIHQIDYNAWFLSMKDTSRELLFSRLGIHWTMYGSLLAADSFIRYIDRQRNIRLPSLQWQKVEHTDEPRRTDDDLAAGLNLIYPMKPEHFTYPEYSYNHDGKRDMPRILYIGDSFLWVWLYDDLMQNISNDFEIWYYFVESWNQNTIKGTEPPGRVEKLDWQARLMLSDCVAILYVPSSFYSFPGKESSIGRLYHYFYPSDNL